MRQDIAVLLPLLMPWWNRAGNATRKTYIKNGETIAIFELLGSECGKDDVKRFWRSRKLLMVRSERVIAASRRECHAALSPACILTEPTTLLRVVKTAVRDCGNWHSALNDFIRSV